MLLYPYTKYTYYIYINKIGEPTESFYGCIECSWYHCHVDENYTNMKHIYSIYFTSVISGEVQITIGVNPDNFSKDDNIWYK